MTRILVTGATGFLGTALCLRLKELGMQVTALGRNPERLASLDAQGITTHSIDLSKTNVDYTERSFGPQDIVVHTAARSAPFGPWEAFMCDNVIGARSVLHMAYSTGAKRLINISTPAVYFRPKDQLGVTEDWPLPAPVNSYARSKRIAEEIFAEASSVETITLRPRGIYGPGDTALLPRLLEAARRGPLPLMNDGRAATDLTHVDDVIDAILAAMQAPKSTSHRVYNISGGEPRRVIDIAEMAAAASGVPVRWQPVTVPLATGAALVLQTLSRLGGHKTEPRLTRYSVGLFAFTQTLNISKAQRELGWSPKVSLDDGLQQTLETPQ